MASFDYNTLRTTAQELITKFGGSFTFVGYNITPADPTMPWKGPTDPRVGGTTAVLTGVVVEPRDLERFGVSFYEDDLTKRAEKVLILSDVGTDLTTFNEVQDPTLGPLKITEVRRLQPDGVTTLLWFVGLRR